MIRQRYALLHIMLASLLFSLQTAAALYINSSYLASFISENDIGLIYTASAILTIVCLHALGSTVTIERLKKILRIILVLTAISLAALGLGASAALIIIGFLVYFICTTLTYYCFDMYIESLSQDRRTGRIRGLMLTLTNVGYMVGPLGAGILVDRTSYQALYLCAATLIIIVTIGMAWARKPSAQNIPQPETTRAYAAFFRNKNLRGVFFANLLLQFFYAWMVIYTPIYLHEYLGISWSVLGIIFTCMLSAFVLFQYHFGRLADKLLGEKELMAGGMLVAGTASAVLGFPAFAGFSVVSIAVLLFTSRIGASALEVASESYFFKHIGPHQTRSLSIFRTTYPLAYTIGPLMASALLDQFPMRYLFFILAGILLVGTLAPLSVRDTR